MQNRKAKTARQHFFFILIINTRRPAGHTNANRMYNVCPARSSRVNREKSVSVCLMHEQKATNKRRQKERVKLKERKKNEIST